MFDFNAQQAANAHQEQVRQFDEQQRRDAESHQRFARSGFSAGQVQEGHSADFEQYKANLASRYEADVAKMEAQHAESAAERFAEHTKRVAAMRLSHERTTASMNADHAKRVAETDAWWDIVTAKRANRG